MKNKDILNYKGTYLFDENNKRLIYVTSVKIVGIFVDGYGRVIYSDGTIHFREVFNLAGIDWAKMENQYGTGWLANKISEDEREYLVSPDLRILTPEEAESLYDDYAKNTKSFFEFK